MYILANFAAYGLNKYKNFLPYVKYTGDLTELSANETYIPSDMLDDVMVATLREEGGMYSAIFTINIDGHMAAYVHDDKGICAIEPKQDDADDLFAVLDAKYNFYVYGLMIEIAPDLWKVVGE